MNKYDIIISRNNWKVKAKIKVYAKSQKRNQTAMFLLLFLVITNMATFEVFVFFLIVPFPLVIFIMLTNNLIADLLLLQHQFHSFAIL